MRMASASSASLRSRAASAARSGSGAAPDVILESWTSDSMGSPVLSNLEARRPLRSQVWSQECQIGFVQRELLLAQSRTRRNRTTRGLVWKGAEHRRTAGVLELRRDLHHRSQTKDRQAGSLFLGKRELSAMPGDPPLRGLSQIASNHYEDVVFVGLGIDQLEVSSIANDVLEIALYHPFPGSCLRRRQPH